LAFLGVEIGAALVSVSVVLGFVLGFALGDTLSNIASGFMIAITKPFKKGDYVTANGESGTIRNVGISITEIDTIDNKRVIIPNKLVWGGNVTNYTHHKTRRVDMEVGVGYNDDLDKVIKSTMQLIKSDKRVLTDPEPQVAVKEMADSAVILTIRPWVKTEDYWDFFFDFQKAIKQKYDKEGISIPFPQRDVHLFQNK
jgi:small conductance mechanosensitive channel